MKHQTITLPETYPQLLQEIKSRIRSARSRAALAANKEMLLLYWDIGKLIVTRQNSEGWGKAVVERLSSDIREEFTDIKGFSSSNMWRMRSFYLAYSIDTKKILQAAREMEHGKPPQIIMEIPWYHNVVLIEKLKELATRLWYAHKTIENGWSRAVLSAQIESELHKRLGSAITNFERTLPPPQSDLAQQTLKDPYVFDFLTLSESETNRPLGVASWKLTGKLPDSLEGELPSPQEIEKHILAKLKTMPKS